jgi:two-component system sensor histidine kinase VicK
VKFDRDKITQVLSNLLSNAIKFTDKGGVTVTAAREANEVHITVKDSGKGIKQNDMRRLFTSFEQLEKAVESKGGTGLGLAISKEIVNCHNGKIWAESEFGKGTTIHFTLPV